MFSYIKGILAFKTDDYAVVDCGGVGFKIHTSINSLTDTDCKEGAEVTFHTYMYIKEGIMDLYGFITKEELEMFELLITVSGVGAKGALSILSSMPIAKLVISIASGDAATIKNAPGIGNKTAQRIVLELKDKVSTDSISDDANAVFTEVVPNFSNERDEAVNALISLGYNPSEAKNAVSKVGSGILNVEDIIKNALKNLM